MLIKVPNRNIIINTDDVSHIFIRNEVSDEARIVFKFKTNEPFIVKFEAQKKPYKAAFDVAIETMEELAKALEEAREEK